MRTTRRLQQQLPCADRKGITLLITVIIVGAITTTIAVSLLLTGVGVTKESATALSATQARSLVEACINAALLKIHDNVEFTGSVPLTLSTGSCSAAVAAGEGPQRTMTASAAVNAATKKTRITLDQLTPNVRIATWEDLADF